MWYVCPHAVLSLTSIADCIAHFSAAGKSQLALQLSLMVQLPKELHGLSGSACFLTTTATLPTTRLMEMVASHPLCSSGHCSLSNIHTIQTPDVTSIIRVLSLRLPDFIQQTNARPNTKPIRLLVIDALTELFHSESKTTSNYLTQRSKDLSRISALLHSLAHNHDIAVIVVNEVTDHIPRAPEADQGQPGEVLFHDQVRLFGASNNVPGGSRKQASLGLVWANQVNARIMLSRTERMRHMDDDEHDTRQTKRPRLDEDAVPHSSGSRVNKGLTRVRRLNVLFNTVAAPAHLDYIITDSGVSVVTEPADLQPSSMFEEQKSTVEHILDSSQGSTHGVTPLDLETIENDLEVAPDGTFIGEDNVGARVAEAEDGPSEDQSEWEQYWKDSTQDSVLYDSIHEPLPSSRELL